ncbi:activated Cdc42 kinase-like isoform X3 [Rhagoletis pomonella]|uniref:activated Cdc42 kinase-like isoform X3 n=1 Tax=Rhagoletis pomonella TaxID=28610 RepID=UPI00177D15A2|nr:activated Cdc42 kinase-like isoform X3 [Rhagoletis pomonella]
MECPQIDLYEFLTEAELQHYYNAIKNELKITNAAHVKYATDEDLKHIGLSRPEIRRLRKFYEKHFPHGYLSKIKRLLQAPATIVKRDSSDGTSTLSNASLHSAAESPSAAHTANSPSKAPNNKHIIPADSITVNKQLGTGEFGIVQQGVWTNGTERIQVAIKCLCRERMQSNPMEFLKEAAIMHSIEHENIVRLYGVVLATDSLMLVTELAHLRSLLECLKDPGLRVSFLTIPTLCEFAMQICNGMSYLENKRLIHRDLAARNILVFSKDKVKISDFGLSRALGVGKDYYKTNFNVNLKLPIAWCAPECINYLRFTNASDVWAYGVCLWEMFSYGFQPWAALTGLQILEAIDAPNYQRLEQPDCCPQEYYTLMMKCWQDDPAKRPKFSEIYELLPDMKPEQLKAVVHCLEPKKDNLLYRQGDIITVLDRNTGTPFWKGVLTSGKTGFFNPSNTVAYLEGLPTANRDSFCRTTERISKRKLRTEMISKPQNDFKHTGHVGIDGDSFGDIAFLGNSQNYNHVPRQIVTPYKPSEDIEQTPLLLPPTPTSPDSLQTASGYFPEEGHGTSMNPTFISSTENTPKHFNTGNGGQPSFEFPGQQPHSKSFTNPFTHKGDDEVLVGGAFAMQNNNYGLDSHSFQGDIAAAQQWREAGKNGGSTEDQHEYHEISDDEITADKLDFGPSLLDEINSMFGSMSASVSVAPPKPSDFEHTNKKNEFTEISSKLVGKSASSGDTNGNKFGTSSKKKSAGTVKPISVKDERILNQAIEIANEISARSMNDLVSDQTSNTQSPKRKFSFRFPHLTSGGGSDKTSGSNGSPTAGGSSSANAAAQKSLSPYSKKKNFTEELESIPDLQRFRSLSEIKNVNGPDLRIPIFDKESSDFCFEKSREILSRPLSLDPPPSVMQTVTPPLAALDAQSQRSARNQKSISENIMDIENTLKALNLDFMHTYTELDKTDSDETLLNEQFSNIVSSIEDEISSATGSLKSAIYNYSNGVQTMFDFNAATSHLDKHLQYINTQNHAQAQAVLGDLTQDQKTAEDKRSSTPDTGFASRDTNISLSRRSSQKSSYSPQENYYSPKETAIMAPSASSSSYMVQKDDSMLITAERFGAAKYGSCASPSKTSALNASSSSVYCSNPLKGASGLGIADAEQCNQSGHRQRSMSFTDNPMNPISPVQSEPQQRLKRRSTHSAIGSRTTNKPHTRSASSYKPRSIRARTLRRLSYNPIILDSSTSSDDDPVSDCNPSIARSECDIRARVSSLYRRRRPVSGGSVAGSGAVHKLLTPGWQDDADDASELTTTSQKKLYGSNVSIKSAPHYNYGTRGMSHHYSRQLEEQFAYEDRIYDFGGGRGPGNNYGGVGVAMKGFDLNGGKMRSGNGSLGIGLSTSGGGCGGSGSGSSSATSSAPPYSGGGVSNTVMGSAGERNFSPLTGISARNAVFHEFDVSRLTGKSPTSNFANSSPEERNRAHPSPPKSLPLPPLPLLNAAAPAMPAGNAVTVAQTSLGSGKQQLEFQWPEKIHASTVKQNELLWRQQQQRQQGKSSSKQQSRNAFLGSMRVSSATAGMGLGLGSGVSVGVGVGGGPVDPIYTSDSSSSDSDEFAFRTEFIPHVPPSPAP